MSIQTLDEEGAAPSREAINGTLYVPDGVYNASDSPDNDSVNQSPATLSMQSGSAQLEAPNTSLATSNITNTSLCGVCKEKEYKYKCSRCYLPYCSIACSTIHKATHPLPALPVDKPLAIQPSKPTPAAARAGTAAAAHITSPFSQLDTSPELRALFKHYPKLVSQLTDIWQAMQPPVSHEPDLYSKLTGKHNNPKAWNQDKGLENGRKALGKAREAWGKDGEGVREFGELILRIVEGVDAEELVRRELERENARIVKALMEGEM